jgi:hypothetical protein
LTNGPGREDAGWVDVKFIETYDPDQDHTIYRDNLKPADETVWYHLNPHRKGSKEDMDKVVAALKGIPNIYSVCFILGYCEIGLKDDGRIYDLRGLPKVVETWPVKYRLRKVWG